MARIIHIKDKEDFLQKYFKPGWNYLREVVEYRDSIIIGKVDVRILIPSLEKQAREALKQVKD